MEPSSTPITLAEKDLRRAVAANILSDEQAERLWHFLQPQRGPVADRRLDFPRVAYYLGALLVIGAMTVFMGLAWEPFGGLGICAIALTYAAAFVRAGCALWRRPELRIVGGLCMTMAVCMTPLALYGFCRWVDIWPHGDPGTYHDYYLLVRGGWLVLEVGTITAGLIALRFISFPFLTAPIAFSLWFMSMDLTGLWQGSTHVSWHNRLLVSLAFGVVMLVAAWAVDYRTVGDEDFAFWGYLFGLLAFSAGLEVLWEGNEAKRALFGLANVGLLLLAILLARPVVLVFGALGLFVYVNYLAFSVFANAWAFPFVVSSLGILLIYLGIKYQQNRAHVERMLLRLLPREFRRWLPRHLPRA